MSVSIVQNYTGTGDPSLLIPKIGTSYKDNPQIKHVVELLKHWQFKAALNELDELIKNNIEIVNALLLKGEILPHFDLNEESAVAYREVLRIKEEDIVAEVLLLVQLTSINDREEVKANLLHSLKEKSPKLHDEYTSVMRLIEKNKNRFEISESEEPFDLICVCGFGLNNDGTIPPTLIRRLEKAEELALENPSAILLLSGGAGLNQYNEAHEMERFLLKRGIEQDRLVVLDRAKDSVGNIIEFTQYIQSGNFDSICIVSSKSHLPRAWMSLKISLEQIHYETSLSADAPDELVTEEMMAIEHKLNLQTLFRVAGLFEKKDIEEKLSI